MSGWMDGWMNGWMDGGMDGWMDEWIDGFSRPLPPHLCNTVAMICQIVFLVSAQII